MSAQKRSFYEVMGVESDATTEEIRAAYKRLSLQLHPDKNRDDEHATEHFQDLVEAYSILRDPQQRARYDANPDGDLNDFEVVFEDDDDELFPEFFFSFSGRGAGRYSRSAFRDLFAEMLFRRVFDEDDDRRYHHTCPHGHVHYSYPSSTYSRPRRTYPHVPSETRGTKYYASPDPRATKVPDRPAKPKVQIVRKPSGQSLAKVSWAKKEPRVPVDKYEVEMAEGSREAVAFHSIYKGAHTTLSWKLKGGGTYFFRVRGMNENGSGEWSMTADVAAGAVETKQAEATAGPKKKKKKKKKKKAQAEPEVSEDAKRKQRAEQAQRTMERQLRRLRDLTAQAMDGDKEALVAAIDVAVADLNRLRRELKDEHVKHAEACIEEARAALEVREERDALHSRISTALRSHNAEEVREVLDQAQAAGRLGYVAQLEQRIEEIGRREEIGELLKAAIESRDVGQLEKAIATAKDAGVGTQAAKKVLRTVRRADVYETLRAAVHSGDVADIQQALEQSRRWYGGDKEFEPLHAKARKRLAQAGIVQKGGDARVELAAAVEALGESEESRASLESAIENARSQGLDVKEATVLLERAKRIAAVNASIPLLENALQDGSEESLQSALARVPEGAERLSNLAPLVRECKQVLDLLVVSRREAEQDRWETQLRRPEKQKRGDQASGNPQRAGERTKHAERVNRAQHAGGGDAAQGKQFRGGAFSQRKHANGSGVRQRDAGMGARGHPQHGVRGSSAPQPAVERTGNSHGHAWEGQSFPNSINGGRGRGELRGRGGGWPCGGYTRCSGSQQSTTTNEVNDFRQKEEDVVGPTAALSAVNNEHTKKQHVMEKHSQFSKATNESSDAASVYSSVSAVDGTNAGTALHDGMCYDGQPFPLPSSFVELAAHSYGDGDASAPMWTNPWGSEQADKTESGELGGVQHSFAVSPPSSAAAAAEFEARYGYAGGSAATSGPQMYGGTMPPIGVPAYNFSPAYTVREFQALHAVPYAPVMDVQSQLPGLAQSGSQPRPYRPPLSKYHPQEPYRQTSHQSGGQDQNGHGAMW